MTAHTTLRADGEIQPSLAELIATHRALQAWTPETDGRDHDVADQIRVALMADCGLSKADADYLTGTML